MLGVGQVLDRKLAKCPQVAPSFDVLRVVCDGTTSTDPKVDGAVRDPPKFSFNRKIPRINEL